MTGTVRRQIDGDYRNQPNVVTLRIAGRDASIIFEPSNPQAMRLAGALKNLDAGDLHVVVNTVAKATRYFASINTQYNPIFGIINLLRDTQSAALNLSTTALAGKERQVLAGRRPQGVCLPPLHSPSLRHHLTAPLPARLALASARARQQRRLLTRLPPSFLVSWRRRSAGDRAACPGWQAAGWRLQQ